MPYLQTGPQHLEQAAYLAAMAVNGDRLDSTDRHWYATAAMAEATIARTLLEAATLIRDNPPGKNLMSDRVSEQWGPAVYPPPPPPPVPPCVVELREDLTSGALFLAQLWPGDDTRRAQMWSWVAPEPGPDFSSEYYTFGYEAWSLTEGNYGPEEIGRLPVAPDLIDGLRAGTRVLAVYSEDTEQVTLYLQPAEVPPHLRRYLGLGEFEATAQAG